MQTPYSIVGGGCQSWSPTETIPDPRIWHHESTKDNMQESLCRHFPRFPDKMAHGVFYAVPKAYTPGLVCGWSDWPGPFFGVSEALLADWSIKLAITLSEGWLQLLRMKKLIATAYYLQCDGLVVCFNITLKTMLQKHAATFGEQWDEYLPGVLWLVKTQRMKQQRRNHHFFSLDWLVNLPLKQSFYHRVANNHHSNQYCHELLMLSLTTAWTMVAMSIQQVHSKYMIHSESHNAIPREYQQWDSVMVRFLEEETGCWRKLSRIVTIFSQHSVTCVPFQTNNFVCNT